MSTASSLRRAVRGGITPGHYDPDAERFTPLAPADAAKVGCPECWAGVSHAGDGWRRFHPDWHRAYGIAEPAPIITEIPAR